MRLATYNIRRCRGRDDRVDPDRVAAVLQEIGADLVALQEVEASGAPEEIADQAAYLARRLSMIPLEGVTLEEGEGTYGNALLTRLPAVRVARIDLSVPGREPRGALDVTLNPPEAPVRVIATHLGLTRQERHVQTGRLLEAIDDPAHPGGGDPVATILLGDVNAWWPAERFLRRLSARLGRSPFRRTWPAHRPMLALDRIWIAPDTIPRRIRAHDSPLARAASDHLPLRADLEVPRSG